MDIQAFRQKCKTGTRVRYVPGHAHEDKNHPDCEDGAVSTIGSENVFVKFDASVGKLGFDSATAQACDPESLVLL